MVSGEDWGGAKGVLESCEGRLLVGAPDERGIAGEGCEGARDFGEVLDEATVEVAEPKELLDLFLRLQVGPLGNRGSLLGVHLNLSFGDDHAEEGDFTAEELAFSDFERESMVLEAMENFADSAPVFFFRVGEDEDVVHVNDDLSGLDHVLEDIVHHALEGCGGVAHSEEHDERFVEAAVGDERGFPLVSVLDSDIREAPADVDFGKVLGSLESVEEFGNEREGITVLDRHVVELSVVLHRAKSTVSLLDEKEGG